MIDLTKEIALFRGRKEAFDLERTSLGIYRGYAEVLEILSVGQIASSTRLDASFRKLLEDFVPFFARVFPSISFDEEDPEYLSNTAEANILSSLLSFRRFESGGGKEIPLLLETYKRLLSAEKALNKA